MSEGKIRIGIGGWTFPPWRGVFYPDKLPQAKECEYATRAMTAIEINATFYGRQKPESWANWEKVAPDGFQFAVKGSRYCVSRSKLAESGDSIANFFGQGFEVLGPKLGPILWQFAEVKFDRDDIAGSSTCCRDAGRNYAAPRDRAAARKLRRREFFDLCRARNIAVVLEDSDEYPTSRRTPPTLLTRGCSG